MSMAESVPPSHARTARAACSRARRRVSSLFSPATVAIDTRGATSAADTPGLTANQPGNAEPQAGDARRRSRPASRHRCSTIALHFEFTYYNKKTKDALISDPLAPSARRRS